MMVYICEKCRFIFERRNEPNACPKCGKEIIREATDKERDEYYRRLANGGKK
jgi:rubrerythrin